MDLLIQELQELANLLLINLVWLEDQAKKEADIKEREQGMKQSIKTAGDYGKVEIS